MLTDTIRLSKQGRDQLITLKRKTGIEHWNVLCRWALCASLAEPSRPLDQKIAADSTIEMTWHTFAGEDGDVYESLIRDRCKRDGISLTEENRLRQFRLHLHRGISYLVGDPTIKSLPSLIQKAIRLSTTT